MRERESERREKRKIGIREIKLLLFSSFSWFVTSPIIFIINISIGTDTPKL